MVLPPPNMWLIEPWYLLKKIELKLLNSVAEAVIPVGNSASETWAQVWISKIKEKITWAI